MIDADAALEELRELKKTPWYNADYSGGFEIREEAVDIVADLCIKRAPTVQIPTLQVFDRASKRKEGVYFVFGDRLYKITEVKE